MTGTSYVSGLKGVWCICDRCSEKKRKSEVTKEWSGLMVCTTTCLDPRPYQMSPPNVWPEGIAVPDARPRPADVFVSAGPIDTSAL